jgi:Secretion system C-terminal sorting domain
VDGGVNWKEDFFESPLAPIQNLVVENEVVWINTYRDLYRRDLSVGTQNIDAEGVAFHVFPNPAKSASKVQISTQSELEGAIDIQLYAINGQLVSTQKAFLQAGNVTVALPILSAGAYKMRVVLDGKVLGSTVVLVQ